MAESLDELSVHFLHVCLVSSGCDMRYHEFNFLRGHSKTLTLYKFTCKHVRYLVFVCYNGRSVFIDILLQTHHVKLQRDTE